MLQSRSSIGFLLLAVGLTVVIRGQAILATATSFDADPDAYQAIARTIGGFGVFGLTNPEGIPQPIAFRPPLYPWLLSLSYSDGKLSEVGIAVFHVLLGSLTSLFVFLFTRGLFEPSSRENRPFVGDWLGLAAAVLTAIDPILLRQSTEVMTETLAATLTAAVIWMWGLFQKETEHQNGWAIPAGLGTLLALAYLCRPTFLVWAILLIIAGLIRSPTRRGLLSVTVIATLLAVAVGGWTLRNVRTLGHPIWATTHGGYTLLLANNESFYRYLSEGQIGQAWNADEFLNAYQHRYQADPRQAEFWQKEWKGPPTYDAAVSEYDDDRLCYESAVATIRRHPTMFVWSAFVRVARLWSPFPHDISGRSKKAVVAVGSYYVILYACVLVAIVRHRRIVFGSNWWAIWLLVFTLTCVHAVYWSNLRMRAPAVPALAILAVLSVGRNVGARPLDAKPSDDSITENA